MRQFKGPVAWMLLSGMLLLTPIDSMAVPFTNGSFEVGTADQPYYTMLTTGSTSIAGWTVSEGSINYITGYWPATDGVRSIGLNGDRAGAISQAFDTVPGMGYDVLFDRAGNVYGGSSLKSLQVALVG